MALPDGEACWTWYQEGREDEWPALDEPSLIYCSMERRVSISYTQTCNQSLLTNDV